MTDRDNGRSFMPALFMLAILAIIVILLTSSCNPTYKWVDSVDNFQITCPSRILRQNGEDFCVIVKCDGVGVALSCNW